MYDFSLGGGSPYTSTDKTNKYVCVCVYIHTYIHTYIYIYIHVDVMSVIACCWADREVRQVPRGQNST